MDFGLDGRNCVVTGASRGIGLATTRLLLREGARVVMVARDAARMEQARRHLFADDIEGGDRVAALPLDVTAIDASSRVASLSAERFGPIDVLVNNAGTSYARDLEALEDEDWQLQWDINVMAPMRMMREIAPQMAERGWGRIVNVCSSAAIRTSMTNPAYSVGKAAELKLSQAFAERFKGTGVAINAVVPGATATGLWLDDGGLADQLASSRGTTRSDVLRAQQNRSLLGRLAEPDEVAALVLLLCSEFAETFDGATGFVGTASP